MKTGRRNLLKLAALVPFAPLACLTPEAKCNDRETGKTPDPPRPVLIRSGTTVVTDVHFYQDGLNLVVEIEKAEVQHDGSLGTPCAERETIGGCEC